MQVVAITLEELVILHLNDDVQVALLAAGASVLPLAGEAKPLAGCDAGGNLDRELPLLVDAPGTATGGARLGDDLSRSAALAARARHGEEALLVSQLAASMTRRARRRSGPLRRAGALARFAQLGAGNLDRRFGAARRLLEGDLEVVPEVGPALRAAAPARAAEQVAESEDVSEAAEHVAEVGED